MVLLGERRREGDQEVVQTSFVDAIFTSSSTRVSLSDFLSSEHKIFTESLCEFLDKPSRQAETLEILELVQNVKNLINDENEKFVCEADKIEAYTTDGKIYCFKIW